MVDMFCTIDHLLTRLGTRRTKLSFFGTFMTYSLPPIPPSTRLAALKFPDCCLSIFMSSPASAIRIVRLSTLKIMGNNMDWFRHIEIDLGKPCLGCIQSGGTISASITSGDTRCTPLISRTYICGFGACCPCGIKARHGCGVPLLIRTTRRRILWQILKLGN